ncbi:mechanosensitive ion channel family protein [Oscillatoria salina]|uniref:mechanosensitive ion channel family protein n=1 Tax=Oscillatoria salina TaxID=331517 RepID=UPI0013B72D73|nr:mechanosensitive ion channel domain-containing protein [Oscillatoria salina]MBZ8179278.1 mechanosensitive ion channel [Oscillatoria salina IIICB1]NET86753.1 mechanosensitive ion channel [Kamptonema sp. SIO1D9]
MFDRQLGLEVTLPDSIAIPALAMALLSLMTLLTILFFQGISYVKLPQLSKSLSARFSSPESQEIIQKLIQPYQGWLIWVIISIIVDLIVLALPTPSWLLLFEFPLSLLLAISTTFLGFRLFSEIFDNYLLVVALDERAKINTELLTLGKFLTKALIVLIVIFCFAQAHQVNLIGLVASLGIGGFAIAFASQKVIEQILWSVVLYIDRPFTVDDYIHLPDRTLGRVESIGWRSTKIRLSGKNTLVVVPNSNLAQINIENLSSAQRVISMVTLTFFRAMSEEEKAILKQLFLDSTSDILGIDRQLTQVNFQDLPDRSGQYQVQAQVIFFILGATDTSMELRRGLLGMARENITKRLQEYGIMFDIKESIVDVSQPMNI